MAPIGAAHNLRMTRPTLQMAFQMLGLHAPDMYTHRHLAEHKPLSI